VTTSPLETKTFTTPTTSVATTAAFVAATGFVVEGVITLVHHTGDHHWDALSQVLNGAYALAALALIVALPALKRWLRLSRIGQAGVIAAQIGCAAMVIESIASGLHDGNILGGLFFGGLLLTLVGQLVLGITGLFCGHRRR
jgi:amino acid transporter